MAHRWDSAEATAAIRLRHQIRTGAIEPMPPRKPDSERRLILDRRLEERRMTHQGDERRSGTQRRSGYDRRGTSRHGNWREKNR